jgi:hypothetical protein
VGWFTLAALSPLHPTRHLSLSFLSSCPRRPFFILFFYFCFSNSLLSSSSHHTPSSLPLSVFITLSLHSTTSFSFASNTYLLDHPSLPFTPSFLSLPSDSLPASSRLLACITNPTFKKKENTSSQPYFPVVSVTSTPTDRETFHPHS